MLCLISGLSAQLHPIHCKIVRDLMELNIIDNPNNLCRMPLQLQPAGHEEISNNLIFHLQVLSKQWIKCF